MPFFEILAVAIALAMDAFAVAIASGAALKVVTNRQTFRLAWHFGLFQAAMPILGWFGGYYVREYFLRFGHWISFVLLLYIGGHMLWEGLRKDEDNACQDPTAGSRLIMLSVATSIDALAVGLSLSVLSVSIVTPVLVIGATTFALSVAGVYIGDVFGHLFEEKLEFIGGLILVGIGAKILWQHLAA
jgi:manganese efflux pump family protein